jgi:hypothetical protein
MVETGAIYLMGGAIHPARGEDATAMVDGIYCARLLDADTRFRRVGALPVARASFRTIPVAGVAGRHLLVR